MKNIIKNASLLFLAAGLLLALTSCSKDDTSANNSNNNGNINLTNLQAQLNSLRIDQSFIYEGRRKISQGCLHYFI